MTDAWLIGLNASTFMIWYEDQDGSSRVYTHEDKITFFSNEESAKDAMSAADLCYQDTVLYDLEKLEQYCAAKTDIAPEDYSFLINFWNLFEDIDYSLNPAFEPDAAGLSDICYDKLFRATDTASLIGEGFKTDPEFTTEETEYILTVMKHGIELLHHGSF